MAKYCANCGTNLPEGAQFCPGCGQGVSQELHGFEQRPAAPRAGGGSSLLIGLGAIVAVLAIALIAIFALPLLTSGDTTGDSSAPAESLVAPELVSPEPGISFDHYPRVTELEWRPVPSAATYTVEVAFFSSDEWSDPGTFSGITTTNHTFDFVGAQPGRWRVWAVASDGKVGPKSGWREFSYTR